MALDLRIVSAQYLKKESIEFDKTFLYALILTRTRMGLLDISLRQFVTKLWPFIHVQNSSYFVSAQYL